MTAPAKAPRASFTVAADLTLNPQRTAADPPELAFSVVGAAMVDDAGNIVTALLRVDAGHYEAAGTLSAGEGAWTLKAEHRDAGLEGTRSITVDLSAPRGEVRLRAASATERRRIPRREPDGPGRLAARRDRDRVRRHGRS